MGILYEILRYFGYFLPMLIFLTLASIFAKRRAGWILFAVGAGVQLISLMGVQDSFDMLGTGSAAMGYWIVYILLACVGIALIKKRNNKNSYSQWESEDCVTKESADTVRTVSPVEPQPIPQSGWRCTCGRSHQAYEASCVCGMTKAEAKKNEQKDKLG